MGQVHVPPEATGNLQFFIVEIEGDDIGFRSRRNEGYTTSILDDILHFATEP
jgi:hypothetical protein